MDQLKSVISFGLAEYPKEPGIFKPIITLKMGPSDEDSRTINFYADIDIEGQGPAMEVVKLIYELMQQRNPIGMFVAEKFGEARTMNELSLDVTPGDRIQ